MLKEVRCLHVDHFVLPSLEAVQISLSDAKGANMATQLLHLTDFLHIRVAVSGLTRDTVLVRHVFQGICHIANVCVELWHVLMEVEGEE